VVGLETWWSENGRSGWKSSYENGNETIKATYKDGVKEDELE